MVIYLNTDPGSLDVGKALERVSLQRREHALQYVKESDRQLSLAAYLLLMEALKKEFGITEPPVFGFGPHGKPFLQDAPRIHFNLSHCPGATLCVVADSPVGCDVENVPEQPDPDLLRTVCNASEVAAVLQSSSPALAFTRLWTQKEAFLKYTGEGISPDLQDILLSPRAKALRFQTTDAPDGSYVYTVVQTAE